MVGFIKKARERFNETISNIEERRKAVRTNELERLRERRKLAEARAKEFQGIATERQKIRKAKETIRKERGSFVDRVPFLRNVNQQSFQEGIDLIQTGARGKVAKARTKIKRRVSRATPRVTTIKFGGQEMKIRAPKKKTRKKRTRRRKEPRNQESFFSF